MHINERGLNPAVILMFWLLYSQVCLFDKGMVSDLCKGWFLSLSLISSYINKFLRMPWCMYNLAPDAGAQVSRKS